MTEYLVILERGHESWGAWSPDLGVYATASTRPEAERRAREAITFHLEGLREAGSPVPEAAASSIIVSV